MSDQAPKGERRELSIHEVNVPMILRKVKRTPNASKMWITKLDKSWSEVGQKWDKMRYFGSKMERFGTSLRKKKGIDKD